MGAAQFIAVLIRDAASCSPQDRGQRLRVPHHGPAESR